MEKPVVIEKDGSVLIDYKRMVVDEYYPIKEGIVTVFYKKSSDGQIEVYEEVRGPADP